MSSSGQAETIARALNGRPSGAGWTCRCPAHDDHDPSLHVTERDGKVLVKCWSGCEQRDVIDALKRRNLWHGKATWGRPKKKDPVAESDKPRDPMKPWRNAAAFVRGSVAGPSSQALWHRAHRRRGALPARHVGPLALADANQVAGDGGARHARQRRRSHLASNVSSGLWAPRR